MQPRASKKSLMAVLKCFTSDVKLQGIRITAYAEALVMTISCSDNCTCSQSEETWKTQTNKIQNFIEKAGLKKVKCFEGVNLANDRGETYTDYRDIFVANNRGETYTEYRDIFVIILVCLMNFVLKNNLHDIFFVSVYQ
jgi:hypothetical protein